MANRWGNQFSKTLIKEVWDIFGKVEFGAAGAPTLVQGVPAASPGIVSVTQQAPGAYVFVFGTQPGMLDVWPRFLNAQVHFNSGMSAPAAPIMYTIVDQTATAGACAIGIQLLDYAGAPANPANGEVGYFQFTFSNSTAP